MDRKLRISLLFQAAGNPKNFLSGMRGEADRTSRALGAARGQVRDLQRTAGDVAAFRKMDAGLGETRTRLQQAKTEVARLGAAMDATDKPSRQMTRGFEVAKTRLRELETQQARQVASLGQLRDRLSAAGVSTDALGAHERRLKRDLEAANGELAEQARRMEAVTDRQRRMAGARTCYDRSQQFAASAQGAGMSSIGAGVAAAAPLIGGGRQAMTFEDGMADIRKVVDFPTPKAFDQMGDDILDLSTRIPLASEGIAAIVASAGQAGFAAGKPWAEGRRELLGFAEDAAKMAVAFDTTADEAGGMMATWRTAYRLSQPAVRSLSDQINYLGNTGPASALKISNVVTRIGALGEVAGLSAGQVAALGATVTGMGVEEEIAATGIKNTMLALTKGEAATKGQRKAYEALGLSATDVAKRMQMDSGGTIVDVLERISKLSPERQAAVMTQLFGSESVAAIAPLLTNLDLLKTNLDKVADASLYSGSMQKEFEARSATASNAVRLGWQGLKAVAVEFGTAFLPQIKGGALALRDFAGDVRTFAAAHPGLTKAAGTLLAVVAAGLLIFGGLAVAVASVLGPFALMQFALTQSGILFGPLGGRIAEVAGKALPWLRSGLLIAGRGFLAFGAAAGRAGLMLLANPITWIVLGIVAAVAVLAGLGFLLVRHWGAVSTFFGNLWTSISSTVSGAVASMGATLLAFTPAGLLISAFLRAWPALQALGGRFMTLGRHLLSGLVNGVVGGVPALVRAVMSAGGALIDGFKRRLGIRSPSRVFARLGDYTMQGMGVGIARSTGTAVGRMRSAAGAVAAAGLVAGPALAAPATLNIEPATAVERPSAEATARPRASGGSPAARAPRIGSLSITIVQRPGEDMDALARRVAELLDKPNPGDFGDDDYGEGD